MVATNVKLSKSRLVRVARIGQTGITRVVSPAHTTADGDLVFAISCGELSADVNLVGIIASELISEAIIRAVKASKSIGGIPSWKEIQK